MTLKKLVFSIAILSIVALSLQAQETSRLTLSPETKQKLVKVAKIGLYSTEFYVGAKLWPGIIALVNPLNMLTTVGPKALVSAPLMGHGGYRLYSELKPIAQHIYKKIKKA